MTNSIYDESAFEDVWLDESPSRGTRAYDQEEADFGSGRRHAVRSVRRPRRRWRKRPSGILKMWDFDSPATVDP